MPQREHQRQCNTATIACRAMNFVRQTRRETARDVQACGSRGVVYQCSHRLSKRSGTHHALPVSRTAWHQTPFDLSTSESRERGRWLCETAKHCAQEAHIAEQSKPSAVRQCGIQTKRTTKECQGDFAYSEPVADSIANRTQRVSSDLLLRPALGKFGVHTASDWRVGRILQAHLLKPQDIVNAAEEVESSW